MSWQKFWDDKASAINDFQATGRGLMDAPGYLHTVAEIVKLLDLRQYQTLADIGCGSGLITLSLSPWLNHICAVDFSPALIERAKSNLKGINNVEFHVGNITNLPLAQASVDKMLVYSVIQYLESEDAVRMAFQQAARILKDGGRALFAANPDPAKRSIYEDILYQRTDKSAAEKEIKLLDNLLWVTQEKLIQMAKELGLHARVEPISNRIWQHFYMFDLIIEKSP
jgi:ubiquinone/menaquinone biosynthesis C-methylase UbiE